MKMMIAYFFKSRRSSDEINSEDGWPLLSNVYTFSMPPAKAKWNIVPISGEYFPLTTKNHEFYHCEVYTSWAISEGN
jgi:hypothetical protein